MIPDGFLSNANIVQMLKNINTTHTIWKITYDQNTWFLKSWLSFEYSFK